MSQAKSQKPKKVEEVQPEEAVLLTPEEEVLDPSVENFDFADHVRIHTTFTGIILSFGKTQAHRGKILIFKKILLPFPIADSLSDVIKRHLEEIRNAMREAKEKNHD